jgi:hypothetical protein
MVEGKLFVTHAFVVATLHDNKEPFDWKGVPKGPHTYVAGNPMKREGNRMMVCSSCGLLQLFVNDPTIFRPREKQGLPRSTGGGTMSDDLPRQSPD